jgi:hypothetical protein
MTVLGAKQGSKIVKNYANCNFSPQKLIKFILIATFVKKQTFCSIRALQKRAHRGPLKSARPHNKTKNLNYIFCNDAPQKISAHYVQPILR